MTTVVLGLDGGCFDLIQPWIKNGDLPNFSKLVREGVATDMQSCLPPVTCPNWQCYSTGTNPGKLGVFWWESIDRENQKIENQSAAGDFDGTHYWRFFEGKKAIINLPTSHPPAEIDGIHVSGGPGAEQTAFTFPASLEQELIQHYEYTVHPNNLSLLSPDDSENECIEEIYSLINTRFDVLEQELASGEYEFIHLTLFYLNVLQHFYWDSRVVKQAWKIIDERMGHLLSKQELDNFVVMSDHGSNEIRTTFRINTWLEEHDYLQTQTSISDYLYQFGITQERIRPLLQKLGIGWAARRLVPNRIQMYLPDEDGSVTKSGKQDIIDWNQSQVVASGQGPLYVLTNDYEKRERIVSELIDKLEELTDRDGNPVFDQVLRANDEYNGSYIKSGPDLILDQAPGVHIEGKIGKDSVFDTPSMWRAENKDTGMFIAFGRDFSQHSKIQHMHILDIAPTLLHLHGQVVPERMDGKVRKELFVSDSAAATRKVDREEKEVLDTTNSESAPRNVANRLEDLGYKQ